VIFGYSFGYKPTAKPNPADVRTKPEKGVIPGSGVTLNAKPLDVKDGAQAAIEGASFTVSFSPNESGRPLPE